LNIGSTGTGMAVNGCHHWQQFTVPLALANVLVEFYSLPYSDLSEKSMARKIQTRLFV